MEREDMEKDEFLNKQINILRENGSNEEDLEEIIPKFKEDINKNFESVLKEITEDIKNETKKFLGKTNINGETYTDGISTCIYLPKENGSYKLTFLAGKDSYGNEISKNTMFDIASITKMFTLLLTFKMVEYGFFNLDDKISELDSRFSSLGDFTIDDILKLCGEFETNGRIQDGKDVDESNKILETISLKSDDRTQNKYNDFGAIILSKVIEKVYYEKTGEYRDFAYIMNKYILIPFGLTETTFNPINNNLAGNGNTDGLVHDPKARALGGAVGSAGLFTTSEDLAKISYEMIKVNYVNYNYMKNLINKDNIEKMGTMTFPNSPQSNKGLLGMYQKNPDRQNKWLVPLIYGNNTFTAQGFTGAVATYDFKNMLHNNFLFNSIKDGGAKKPDGFMDEFKNYQYYIVGKTMELYMLREYEKVNNNSSNNIEEIHNVR